MQDSNYFALAAADALVMQLSPTASEKTVAPLDAARFEQLLHMAEKEQIGIDLVNAGGAALPSEVAGGALDAVRSASNHFRTTFEKGVRTFASLDPFDPRMTVSIIESSLSFGIANAHLHFSMDAANACKNSLNTLLRSQG